MVLDSQALRELTQSLSAQALRLADQMSRSDSVEKGQLDAVVALGKAQDAVASLFAASDHQQDSDALARGELRRFCRAVEQRIEERAAERVVAAVDATQDVAPAGATLETCPHCGVERRGAGAAPAAETAAG